MRADPLTIVAVVTCGVAWLLAASFLILHLLGRLPGGRARNARAFRLQQTAGLVLMTTILLFQVGGLAHWPRPVRLVLDVLLMLAGVGTLAVVMKAAPMWSEAKRTQAALDASSGASPAGSCRLRLRR